LPRLNKNWSRQRKTLAETAGTLRPDPGVQESDRGQPDVAHPRSFSACTTKNESLHRLGVALIKQYEEKSCLGSVLQREPLTQLKSVDVENMVDEFIAKSSIRSW